MCCAFSNFLFIFCINACQSLSTRGAHPTIERSIRFLTTSSFWSWFEVKGQVIRPNTIVGVMTESKSFKRSLKDTCRFRSVSLCSLNFIQAIWLRCCISTMALFRRSPDNFLPKYLWFCSPCNTSILSPPITRNIGSFKLSVVKILVLEVFKFKPMLLRFTSCALNGPPLGIQDQSQKKVFILINVITFVAFII